MLNILILSCTKVFLTSYMPELKLTIFFDKLKLTFLMTTKSCFFFFDKWWLPKLIILIFLPNVDNIIKMQLCRSRKKTYNLFEPKNVFFSCHNEQKTLNQVRVKKKKVQIYMKLAISSLRLCIFQFGLCKPFFNFVLSAYVA